MGQDQKRRASAANAGCDGHFSPSRLVTSTNPRTALPTNSGAPRIPVQPDPPLLHPARQLVQPRPGDARQDAQPERRRADPVTLPPEHRPDRRLGHVSPGREEQRVVRRPGRAPPPSPGRTVAGRWSCGDRAGGAPGPAPAGSPALTGGTGLSVTFSPLRPTSRRWTRSSPPSGVISSPGSGMPSARQLSASRRRWRYQSGAMPRRTRTVSMSAVIPPAPAARRPAAPAQERRPPGRTERPSIP